jgi:signal transduction histidine kinase
VDQHLAEFTVDTHIFRELGQLLVGRDSTALVELIKNSYDADASVVSVYGEQLDSPRGGIITVVDDGTGIALSEFANSFLRIASRTKTEGGRRSRRFGRRYTGAKGIGRLAAHKLARVLEVDSDPWREGRNGDLRGVHARIDWDAVEEHETLEDVAATDAVILEGRDLPRGAKPGTRITLRRLRRRWTADERGRFLAEVETFEPSRILVDRVPDTVAGGPMLLEQLAVRDVEHGDPGFRVSLEGDFEPGEQFWPSLAQTSAWIIEIDARPGEPLVEFLISPTRRTQREFPEAEKHRFTVEHPDPITGPFFQARIFVREGGLKGLGPLGPEARAWARRAAGIRVYMEGFRVLPYGEPKNDWLDIDADYTERRRSLPWIAEEPEEARYEDRNVGLSLLRNESYFGAVCLTEAHAPTLRMLVNREGFEPSEGFQSLIQLVRAGTDLSVRVRAATSRNSRLERRERRAVGAAQLGSVQMTSRQLIQGSLERVTTLTKTARHLAENGELARATNAITSALSEFEVVRRESEELISEDAMIRVLASVGTQLAAFTHEVNGLLAMVQSIDGVLKRLRGRSSMPQGIRQELARLHSITNDLRRALEFQASYLVAVVAPDARRRRARQILADRFDVATRLVEHSAQARSIDISNDIPDDLKSPPMFQAETVAVFSNLLTNAVKAAGDGGRIRASGRRLSDGKTGIRIENTGVTVDMALAEKWFRPFQSTTTEVDPVLGQGLGLGLPITRSILEEYGATIQFVPPGEGFATAVEIEFPK